MLNMMLKHSSLPRLLKEVQISLGLARDGVTHSFRMGIRRGVRLIPLVVSLSNHAAPHPSGRWVPGAGAPTAGGSQEMGLFQQPPKP